MPENVGFGANKLVICVPGCETPVSVAWGINLAGQYWPLNVSIEYASQDGLGQDMDLLRNYSAAYALGTKSKYVWFLKEEVLPPNWAMHRLLEAINSDPSIMICAAMSETNVPESVEFKDDVLKVFVDENQEKFELLEIMPNNYVGLECTLVKAELFDKIDEPWFKSSDLVNSASFLCHKTMEAGFKVTAHSGVLCGYVNSAGKTIQPAGAVIPQTV